MHVKVDRLDRTGREVKVVGRSASVPGAQRGARSNRLETRKEFLKESPNAGSDCEADTAPR